MTCRIRNTSKVQQADVLTFRWGGVLCRFHYNRAQEWKAAGSPVPLCLVMYEPVVTLLSMSVVLAAMGADDSKHLRWLNDLERSERANSTIVVNLITT